MDELVYMTKPKYLYNRKQKTLKDQTLQGGCSCKRHEILVHAE